MTIPDLLAEDLARLRIDALRDEAAFRHTVRRARRLNDSRWIRRRK